MSTAAAVTKLAASTAATPNKIACMPWAATAASTRPDLVSALLHDEGNSGVNGSPQTSASFVPEKALVSRIRDGHAVPERTIQQLSGPTRG
jgi:hypothetical protein